MDISDELLAIASRHEEELTTLFWASEKDRWTELLFCVLNAFLDDPVRARELVATLAGAGLTEPDVLAQAGAPGAESGAALRFILGSQLVEPADVTRAAGLLTRIASVTENRFQGKLQRYLRRQGELMRDDLAGMFGDAGQPEGEQPAAELRLGLTHWLQNACGIPISVQDSSIQRFCEQRGVTVTQLADAADEIDFNLALVDDVIKAELDLVGGSAAVGDLVDVDRSAS